MLLKIASGAARPVTARVKIPVLARGDEMITSSGSIRHCIAAGISDNELESRHLALFFADHKLQPALAVRIAREDLERRQDIYAWDTLAWALCRNDELDEAVLRHPHDDAVLADPLHTPSGGLERSGTWRSAHDLDIVFTPLSGRVAGEYNEALAPPECTPNIGSSTALSVGGDHKQSPSALSWLYR